MLWKALAALMVVAVTSNVVIAADVTPPQLVSWVQYPDEIDVTNGPAIVYAEFRVVDDETGTEQPRVGGRSLSTSQSSNFVETRTELISGDELDGVWRATVVIDQGAAPGPWELLLYPLRDEQGNSQSGFGPVGYNTRFRVVSEVAVSEAVLRMALEEPVQETAYAGIGNLRGWAVSTAPLSRIEVWIDGKYEFNAPYGGQRLDVGTAFPDVRSSAESGFSLAFNYGDLEAGFHEIAVVAVTISGESTTSAANFEVVRFESNFIGSEDAVRLEGASCVVAPGSISILDVSVEDMLQDIRLQWKSASQGFEIVEIR